MLGVGLLRPRAHVVPRSLLRHCSDAVQVSDIESIGRGVIARVQITRGQGLGTYESLAVSQRSGLDNEVLPRPVCADDIDMFFA